MAGPLSKFIGRDRDGNSFEGVVSTPVVKSEPDKFETAKPSMFANTIRAWAIIRFNQEKIHLDKVIAEANYEIAAINRRQAKVLRGLDEAQIASIMEQVEKLSAGLKLPEPETIEEPDDEI